MKTGTMKLGQAGEWKDEGTWLFITHQDGEYLLWSEDEDEEFREDFDIDTKKLVARVKVKRFQNAARNAYATKASRRYTQRGRVPPPKAMEKILRDSVAHEVLEDWEGIIQEDGSASKYSPEAGKKAFEDDDMFFQVIITAAHNREYHRAVAIQKDVEALGEASGGA